MSVQKSIFDFVYTMALRDATMQKAYEGEKKHLFDNKAPKKTVEKYVEKVLAGKLNNQEKADKVTKETIEQLVKDFSDDGFTFGNAQKLLNMTMKYLYIGVYGDPAKEKKYKELFRFCDCPMDSQMIAYVIGKRTEKEAASILKEKTRALYGDTRWSMLSDKPDAVPHNSTAAYYEFQKIVRALAAKEELIPIEFDFVHFG